MLSNFFRAGAHLLSVRGAKSPGEFVFQGGYDPSAFYGPMLKILSCSLKPLNILNGKFLMRIFQFFSFS